MSAIDILVRWNKLITGLSWSSVITGSPNFAKADNIFYNAFKRKNVILDIVSIFFVVFFLRLTFKITAVNDIEADGYDTVLIATTTENVRKLPDKLQNVINQTSLVMGKNYNFHYFYNKYVP